MVWGYSTHVHLSTMKLHSFIFILVCRFIYFISIISGWLHPLDRGSGVQLLTSLRIAARQRSEYRGKGCGEVM
jgi:hypothetical protein